MKYKIDAYWTNPTKPTFVFLEGLIINPTRLVMIQRAQIIGIRSDSDCVLDTTH